MIHIPFVSYQSQLPGHVPPLGPGDYTGVMENVESNKPYDDFDINKLNYNESDQAS
jgi:hypothetical protein